MLSHGNVIIHCPDEDLAGELFDILEDHGIRWYGGDDMKITHWGTNEEETCYRVTSDGKLMFGYTHLYEDGEYNGYVKCQFYGIESADDEISDSDFEAIISAVVDKGGKALVG